MGGRRGSLKGRRRRCGLEGRWSHGSGSGEGRTREVGELKLGPGGHCRALVTAKELSQVRISLVQEGSCGEPISRRW